MTTRPPFPWKDVLIGSVAFVALIVGGWAMPNVWLGLAWALIVFAANIAAQRRYGRGLTFAPSQSGKRGSDRGL
jgi:hypothetical protein